VTLDRSREGAVTVFQLRFDSSEAPVMAIDLASFEHPVEDTTRGLMRRAHALNGLALPADFDSLRKYEPAQPLTLASGRGSGRFLKMETRRSGQAIS
jgi:hypothetical protein